MDQSQLSEWLTVGRVLFPPEQSIVSNLITVASGHYRFDYYAFIAHLWEMERTSGGNDPSPKIRNCVMCYCLMSIWPLANCSEVRLPLLSSELTAYSLQKIIGLRYAVTLGNRWFFELIPYLGSFQHAPALALVGCRIWDVCYQSHIVLYIAEQTIEDVLFPLVQSQSISTNDSVCIDYLLYVNLGSS